MGYIDAPAGNPAFSTSSNPIPLAKIFNTVCSVAKHFAIKARKYLLRNISLTLLKQSKRPDDRFDIMTSIVSITRLLHLENPHSVDAEQVARAYDEALANLPPSSKLPFHSILNFHHSCASVAGGLGDHDKAKKLYLKSLQLLQNASEAQRLDL